MEKTKCSYDYRDMVLTMAGLSIFTEDLTSYEHSNFAKFHLVKYAFFLENFGIFFVIFWKFYMQNAIVYLKISSKIFVSYLENAYLLEDIWQGSIL